MLNKNIIPISVLTLVVMLGALFSVVQPSSVAHAASTCPSNGTVTDGCTCPSGQTPQYIDSRGTATCVSSGNGAGSSYYSDPSGDLATNPIIKWLKNFINLFAAIVGVGAVIMIIWGGLQYTSARDNPQAVQSAKMKIVNVFIGIIAFVFLYAFMQWLIPGGAL